MSQQNKSEVEVAVPASTGKFGQAWNMAKTGDLRGAVKVATASPTRDQKPTHVVTEAKESLSEEASELEQKKREGGKRVNRANTGDVGGEKQARAGTLTGAAAAEEETAERAFERTTSETELTRDGKPDEFQGEQGRRRSASDVVLPATEGEVAVESKAVLKPRTTKQIQAENRGEASSSDAARAADDDAAADAADAAADAADAAAADDDAADDDAAAADAADVAVAADDDESSEVVIDEKAFEAQIAALRAHLAAQKSAKKDVNELETAVNVLEHAMLHSATQELKAKAIADFLDAPTVNKHFGTRAKVTTTSKLLLAVVTAAVALVLAGTVIASLFGAGPLAAIALALGVTAIAAQIGAGSTAGALLLGVTGASYANHKLTQDSRDEKRLLKNVKQEADKLVNPPKAEEVAEVVEDTVEQSVDAGKKPGRLATLRGHFRTAKAKSATAVDDAGKSALPSVDAGSAK